jgi:predicted metal-binding membrane protein
MGVRHGVYCLGCCWALFAVLVAVGLMSVAWMLLLTLVVAIEKLLPLGQRASAGIGIGLIVLGVAVASGAVLMPWLAAADGGPG